MQPSARVCRTTGRSRKFTAEDSSASHRGSVLDDGHGPDGVGAGGRMRGAPQCRSGGRRRPGARKWQFCQCCGAGAAIRMSFYAFLFVLLSIVGRSTPQRAAGGQTSPAAAIRWRPARSSVTLCGGNQREGAHWPVGAAGTKDRRNGTIKREEQSATSTQRIMMALPPCRSTERTNETNDRTAGSVVRNGPG